MRNDHDPLESAKDTTPFMKIRKEICAMSKEERHLQTKIRIFEDILIRCKNFSQMASIQAELTKMRIKLQKLEYERLES